MKRGFPTNVTTSLSVITPHDESNCQFADFMAHWSLFGFARSHPTIPLPGQYHIPWAVNAATSSFNCSAPHSISVGSIFLYFLYRHLVDPVGLCCIQISFSPDNSNSSHRVNRSQCLYAPLCYSTHIWSSSCHCPAIRSEIYLACVLPKQLKFYAKISPNVFTDVGNCGFWFIRDMVVIEWEKLWSKQADTESVINNIIWWNWQQLSEIASFTVRTQKLCVIKTLYRSLTGKSDVDRYPNGILTGVVRDYRRQC